MPNRSLKSTKGSQVSKRRKRLVLFLYSTSTQNLVFAHQIHVAVDLSHYFEETIVITAQSDFSFDSQFSNVIDLKWTERNMFSKIWNLVKVFFRVVFVKRHETVIFSYMTEVQSAILALLTKVTHIPHYLWYAHTTKSIYLRWCHFWLNGIVTSTSGSCPYRDSKVKIIGQNIDETTFRYSPRSEVNLRNGLYVGRLDRSKKIENIISLLRLSEYTPNLKITLVGESTTGNESYLEELKFLNRDLIENGLLKFAGKIPNSSLPDYMFDFNFFINAFDGSLDKSLLEATFLGLPVITTNLPYLNYFGSWSRVPSEDYRRLSLLDEYLTMKQLGASERENICRKRAALAVANHSRSQWIPTLVNILDK